MIIAQSVQDLGGIFQDDALFLQIGEGVEPAVGHEEHPGIALGLEEHDVAEERAGAQPRLVQDGPHEVGRAQNPLHEEMGLALGHQGDGLVGTVHIAVSGDDLIGVGILPQLGQDAADGLGMTHQDGLGDAAAAGHDHSIQNGAVVGGGHGHGAVRALDGGKNDLVQGIQHKNRLLSGRMDGGTGKIRTFWRSLPRRGPGGPPGTGRASRSRRGGR